MSETETTDPRCGTCGDKRVVSVKLETWTGPVLREIDCPDCKGGTIRVEDVRDSQLKKVLENQDSLSRVVRNIGLAVLVLTVLFVLKAMQEGKIPPPEIVTKVTDIGEPA